MIFFNFFLLLLQKIEPTKCNKNAILHKKLEIKIIIYDFKEFIEACGSNYSEKTVNTLKKISYKVRKSFFVMQEMIILEI